MANASSTRESEPGLLEQPALTLISARPHRSILGADQREVGFAVWNRRAWWCWSTLSVHEQPDGPLVFTVTRRWLWPLRREVRDAEGELVGELAGRRILDRWGDAVMWRDRDHIADLTGVILAQWSATETGLRLEFRPDVRPDPFACMLVLAALLV